MRRRAVKPRSDQVRLIDTRGQCWTSQFVKQVNSMYRIQIVDFQRRSAFVYTARNKVNLAVESNSMNICFSSRKGLDVTVAWLP